VTASPPFPPRALLALLIALSPPSILYAETASSSWTGTWTLNLERSTYVPERPPFRRATRKIEQSGEWTTIVDDIVGSRGGIVHLEWTGRFDGTDYAVEGIDVVLTNAYRRIDDRQYELVQKMDGKVVATARLSLSADGRTITTVTASQTGSATTVHEKR
jgi:hypothetical protein